MSKWTFAAYIARLTHEIKSATTERGETRLRRTLAEVSHFLNDTDTDPNEQGWIDLLRAYERGCDAVGMRHEWPDGCHPLTGVV